MSEPTSPQPSRLSWTRRPEGISAAAPAPVAGCAAPAPHAAPRALASGAINLDERFFQALDSRGLVLHHAQREAVRHSAGPLLCLAGAGSGKTSVLTTRAAYLLAVHGAPPESLLLVTFTSKAAAEMRERLGRMPGVTAAMARRVQARTFHSFALTLLQAYAPPFKLLAEERARHGFMRRIVRELGLQEQLQAETVLAALSALKSRGDQPSDWKTDGQAERDMRRAMLRFEEQKRERGLKDFDDLMLDTLAMLEQAPELVAKLSRRFRYVMVDEYQDTTPVQLRLIRLITDSHRNLAVFGDDDQTIYTFNGANHRYITGFKDMYPEATQVTLDLNFRSTPSIVGLGNAIIRHNEGRLVKTMKVAQSLNKLTADNTYDPSYLRPNDPEQEAELIAARIRELVEREGRSYKDIAVLYRTAHASRALIELLTMNGMPFIQLGAEPLFYDHALVKPLIDHLRLSLEPRNREALGSAVAALYISRDAGIEYIQQAEAQRAKKYPLVHLATCPSIASYQQEAVKPRIRYIKKLADMKPYYAIRDMRREFYDKYTTALSGAKATAYQEAAAETLEELETAAKRFDTVEKFIAHIDELRARQQEQKQTHSSSPAHEEDSITCMTIHRAKGLEFPCVFLIGITEELLPHRSSLKDKPHAEQEAAASIQNAAAAEHSLIQEDNMLKELLEEERRLLYVGVTRAKEQLFISSPAVLHGKKQKVSRFLMQAWQQAPVGALK